MDFVFSKDYSLYWNSQKICVVKWHQVAAQAWLHALRKGYISTDSTLFHIDQHHDLMPFSPFSPEDTHEFDTDRSDDNSYVNQYVRKHLDWINYIAFAYRYHIVNKIVNVFWRKNLDTKRIWSLTNKEYGRLLCWDSDVEIYSNGWLKSPLDIDIFSKLGDVPLYFIKSDYGIPVILNIDLDYFDKGDSNIATFVQELQDRVKRVDLVTIATDWMEPDKRMQFVPELVAGLLEIFPKLA